MEPATRAVNVGLRCWCSMSMYTPALQGVTSNVICHSCVWKREGYQAKKSRTLSNTVSLRVAWERPPSCSLRGYEPCAHVKKTLLKFQVQVPPSLHHRGQCHKRVRLWDLLYWGVLLCVCVLCAELSRADGQRAIAEFLFQAIIVLAALQNLWKMDVEQSSAASLLLQAYFD